MSKDTWRAEFFPTDASTARNMTNLEAVRHSLRKWRGLTPDNLKAHGLRVSANGSIMDGPQSVLGIDDTTCSLCVKHFAVYGMLTAKERCRSCPLARARSGYPCDKTTRKETDLMSPWRVWMVHEDPRPMIGALEKAEATLVKAQKLNRSR